MGTSPDDWNDLSQMWARETTIGARARLAAGLMLSTALVVAPTAAAQDDGGTQVGGEVRGLVQLLLDDGTGLGSLPAGPATPSMTIVALATATVPDTTLWIADGDAQDGPGHGHLSAGSSVLGEPLEARTAGAFKPLDDGPAAWLSAWSSEHTNSEVRITVRQRRAAGRPAVRPRLKVLLISTGPQTP